MPRILDAVTLPAGIEWTDRHSWRDVAQTNRRTLGGGLYWWAMPTTGGRPVSLSLDLPGGFFSYAEKIAIEALAATAGGEYTLVWDSETYTVRFNAAPSFTPVYGYETASGESADVFTGTIPLITV